MHLPLWRCAGNLGTLRKFSLGRRGVKLPAETVDTCTAPWHLLSKGWCLAHADSSLKVMTLCPHQMPDTSRCCRFCSVLWVQETYAKRFFACCKKKSGQLWWKATFDSVAGICWINDGHRCSCGSWNGGFMWTEAGYTATCHPASPEMGAQDDPYLLPSASQYGTNFNILVYLKCEHF